MDYRLLIRLAFIVLICLQIAVHAQATVYEVVEGDPPAASLDTCSQPLDCFNNNTAIGCTRNDCNWCCMASSLTACSMLMCIVTQNDTVPDRRPPADMPIFNAHASDGNSTGNGTAPAGPISALLAAVGSGLSGFLGPVAGPLTALILGLGLVLTIIVILLAFGEPIYRALDWVTS
jgi:hypothetical protein